MKVTPELEKILHRARAPNQLSIFLEKEQLFGVDDVALVCTKEELLDETLIAPAKAGGVPCDSLAEKVCIKKVWALCREAFATGRHGQPASQTEQEDQALPDEVKRSLDGQWEVCHGFVLNSLLSEAQQNKIYRMSHGAPRAFPIVLLESMRLLCRLSDGKSVKAASSAKDSNASEEVSGVFELWTRLRAFFTTLAYISVEGGQNGATGSQFTHRPTFLDSWATQCRMVQERFPQSALSQFPSDFKKCVQTSSSGTKFGRLCCNGAMAPAETLSSVHGGPYTVFFGGKSCLVNFARVPDWCCHALATMAGLATSHCVGDVLAVDRKTTIFSRWLVWRVLAACCGWVVPDSKSPLPSQVHRILGATSDLSLTPCFPPTLSISQDRVSQLTCMIKDVLESGHLHPAMAGKLWGHLGFSCTQMFGRFGRAKLRPFSRRQHEHRRIWLNHQLTSALKWWLEILSCSPPRVIPTNLSERRRIASCSDGEGSEAGVGVAL